MKKLILAVALMTTGLLASEITTQTTETVKSQTREGVQNTDSGKGMKKQKRHRHQHGKNGSGKGHGKGKQQ